MNNEDNELIEQIEPMVNPVVLASQVLFTKMGDNDKLIEGIVNFHMKLISEFKYRGCSHDDAVKFTMNIVSSIRATK